ncbi:hypothetical protein HLA86_11055 [Staphylococcus caprae]|uniref:hypothetical protein n=1 Tax=Staphylococcus caprae TaxID=29380 RepID=UPI001C829027|nr:hypothetical protein [Staphylococcus caprae]MBX5320075.1 hypothetical protein [Staphylococcus caprae]
MNVREETVTVNATVKIKYDFPVWLNNHTTLEDEKEKLLDVIAENPEKELMNENFEFVDFVEVE